MNTDVYILAGGKSSRFGQDKARARYNGETLMQRVARACTPAAREVYAVVGPHQDYSDLGLQCLTEDPPHHGPLGGIVCALEHAQAQGQEWILVVACDLVQLDVQWLTTLGLHARAPAQAVAYRDAHWHPLCALYHVSGLGAARKELIHGRRRVHRFLDEIDAVAVDPPHEGFHTAGVNTPRDLAHLKESP